MLLNHFREKHGFSQVEDKGRGTVLRRCIYEGKVPKKGGKIFVNNSELPSPLSPRRLILVKKNAPINMQGHKLENMPNDSAVPDDGDFSKSYQCNVEEKPSLEKHLQNEKEAQNNREESFYACSNCDYASINEHELNEHVQSTHHVKVETEDQSRSSLGTPHANSGNHMNELETNNDLEFKEVLLQYKVGHEESVEGPKPEAKPRSNEDSDDEFIAMEGPENSSTNAKNLKARIKEVQINLQTPDGAQGDSYSITRNAFKCDWCDYVTKHKSDLDGHVGAVHGGLCGLCDYSSIDGNQMIQHYSNSHPLPPPPDKPISKWVDGLGKNKKQSVARDPKLTHGKSRQQQDLNNSMERLRRLDQKILFDLLKDMVPEVKDRKTASKKLILDEAAKYTRMLGVTDLELTKEREHLAKRNVELAAKLQYLVEDDMEYIETEEKDENGGIAGGSVDSGFSSDGGPELNGLDDYLPIVESAFTMSWAADI